MSPDLGDGLVEKLLWYVVRKRTIGQKEGYRTKGGLKHKRSAIGQKED